MQPSYPTTPPTRFWRIVHFPLVTLVIGIAILTAISVFYQAAAGAVVRRMAGGPSAAANLVVVIGAVAVAIAAYRLFNRFVERRGNVEFALPDAGRELAAGIAAGVVLFSVVVGVIWLGGGYHVTGLNALAATVPMLSVSILSGFVEEIFFRGLIFRLVEQWLGSWAALAVSAALFGAAHLSNANSSPQAAVAIAIEAGVMLGAIYMLTRRLWAAIGLHGAWNFAQGGIYGVPVSGMAMPGLLRETPSGPDWLTGGAFGAEASLPAVAICTLFGLAVLAAAIRHDRVVPFLPRRAGPRSGPAIRPL